MLKIKFLSVYLIVSIIAAFLPLHHVIASESDYDYMIWDEEEAIVNEYIGSGGDVIIPNSLGGYPVVEIGDQAFEGKANVTSVIIPNSVTGIGASAFRECIGLVEIDIPDSIQFMGSFNSGAAETIFQDCSNLTAINVGLNNPRYKSIDGVLFDKEGDLLYKYPEGKAGKYIIPQDVSTIYDTSFYGSSKLTEVTIPEGINRIGMLSFIGCSSLEKAIFLGDAPYWFGDLVGTDQIMPDMVFSGASNFTIYFNEGAEGFTTPTWNGYPTQIISASSSPSPAPTATLTPKPTAVVSAEPTATPTQAIDSDPTQGQDEKFNITGQLKDGQGNPITDRKIELLPGSLTASTDEDGSYSFEDIPLEPHTFKVYNEDGTEVVASKDIEIVTGDETGYSEGVLSIKGEAAFIELALDGEALDITYASDTAPDVSTISDLSDVSTISEVTNGSSVSNSVNEEGNKANMGVVIVVVVAIAIAIAGVVIVFLLKKKVVDKK